MEQQLLDLKDTLLKVAYEAGEAILGIYSQEDFDEEIKSDNSPLTRADKSANQIICQTLEKLEPGYPIISEENKEVPYQERKDYSRYWLVDPLDGTKEFIKRNGEFTVNIALIEDNKPVLGVVYAPVLEELYWGIENVGSFLIKKNEETPLRVNRFKLAESGLRLVCSRSHLNKQTELYLKEFDKPLTVSKGSSLKFMLLAKNKADIYPRLAPTMEWDTAAAQIILEQAGGQVLEYDTQMPMRYNKEDLLNPFFIASGEVQ